MLKLKLLMALVSFATTPTAQAAGKCIFEEADVKSGTIGQSSYFRPLKRDGKESYTLDLTRKMLKNFWDKEFKIKECRQAISETFYYSVKEDKYYIMYATNEDECDGGNTYGFIVETNAHLKAHLKVVALINDYFIECK